MCGVLIGYWDYLALTPLTIFDYDSVCGAVANSQLQSTALWLFHTACLQFTSHALTPLSLLSLTTLLVPASNGGRSFHGFLNCRRPTATETHNELSILNCLLLLSGVLSLLWHRITKIKFQRGVLSEGRTAHTSFKIHIYRNNP
jgi:hypothetical protein